MRPLKFIVITSALLVFSVTSYAKDIREGTIEISGDFNVSYTQQENKTAFSTNDRTIGLVDLTLSTYVTQNIGVGILFNHLNENANPGGTVKSTALGPIGTYNIPLDQSTSIKLTGALFFLTGSGFQGKGIELQSMFNYFLTDDVSLNSGLSITISTIDNTGFGSTTSDVTDITLEIGFSFYIN